MKWAVFVTTALAAGLFATVPETAFLAVVLGFVGGACLPRRRTVRLTGSVRYIYDNGRCRLHLDECPVIAGAREGDLVVVDVRKVEG